MATKTPSKGKKASPDKVKSAPKKARAPKASPAEAKDEDAPEGEAEEDLEDDDLDEAPKAAAPAKKPAAPAGKSAKGTATGEDAPQVVPARRLTPEAKTKINELVAKGMPLGDALRAAGSWETFVAPVREEPAKLVQGRSFEGGGHPGPKPAHREPREKTEERDDDESEESIGTADTSDDE